MLPVQVRHLIDEREGFASSPALASEMLAGLWDFAMAVICLDAIVSG
jgi:hypothetical protein